VDNILKKQIIMKKQLLFILTAAFATLALVSGAFAQLSYRVEQPNDWVFSADVKPAIPVVIKNNSDKLETRTLSLTVMNDIRESYSSWDSSVWSVACPVIDKWVIVQPNDSVTVTFIFDVKNPGFYRCIMDAYENAPSGSPSVQRNADFFKIFTIGYEPTKIISSYDAQPDFKEFWDKTKQELASIKPEYQLTQIKTDTNKYRKLYLVKMKSLGGVEIQGYYSTPAQKGKYPAEIHYMGYGSKPWIPGGYPDRVEFILSTRNQGLLEDTTVDNTWLTWGFDNKDHYYYRGAFMDLIRAIDFVASRPEVDVKRIVAEGGSQGGGFTLAAAALDNRLRAIAPSVSFHSDYSDYFKIVDWPGIWFINKQHELGMSDEDFYKMLSYFDVKNFASWITCPVLMCVGLQDDVCPPHTNFAPYNLITSEKYYVIYPNQGHSAGMEWWQQKEKFLKKYLFD
jgi:cephalosporin-C deacetylase